MRVQIAFLALFPAVKCLSFWFNIETSGKTLLGSTMAGPNGGYIVQGESRYYSTYEINWGAGSASIVKNIDIGTTTHIAVDGRIITEDGGFNVVMTGETVYRFNSQQGQADSIQQYSSLPTGDRYSYPRGAHNKIYVFVAFMWSGTKLYRLHADRTSDVLEFTTGGSSRAFGVLNGTPLLLVTVHQLTQRLLFDYTTGAASGTHPKPTGQEFELGFVSPEDERGVYVVHTGPSSILKTVTVSSGNNLLTRDLTSVMSGMLGSITWIYDTDLCLLPGSSTTMLLVDFMDPLKTNIATQVVIDTVTAAANLNANSGIWID